MRIAFPYPSYWPYVRRGAERCLHDLAQFLARRGHEVHLITSTPGNPRTTYEGEVKVTYVRQLSHPVLYRYAPYFRFYAFGVEATRVLIRERPDVVHLQSYSGISWAPLLRRVLRLPYVLQIIMLNHYWPGRLDRVMFSQLVRRADQVVALTRLGARAVEAEYRVPCGVLPPPLDMETFRPCSPRDLKRPRVLFAADLADTRKGGVLLLQAWNTVHRKCPEAILVLGGSFGLGGFMQLEFGVTTLARLNLVKEPSARAAIEVRGPGDVESLPAWYSQAAVTVLPSVEEAFGMVLTESLACGTPVVASSAGGSAEIVANREIGATVDLAVWRDLESRSRAEELADAILHCIALSRGAGTAEKCRDWASQWSLDRVGFEEENLLERVALGRKGTVAAGVAVAPAARL